MRTCFYSRCRIVAQGGRFVKGSREQLVVRNGQIIRPAEQKVEIDRLLGRTPHAGAQHNEPSRRGASWSAVVLYRFRPSGLPPLAAAFTLPKAPEA